MKEQVKKLINSGFDAINKSIELSLLLTNTYRYLFLNNKPGSTCGCTLKMMYTKLSKEGLQIIEIMANKTFTLKPGIHHIHSLGKHVSDVGLTEEKAIEYLNNGHLNERHFNVLPKSYDPKKKPEPQKEAEKIELKIENKGKFTIDNLDKLNGEGVMSFAQKIQPDQNGTKPQKPQSKIKAIDIIMSWQKEAEKTNNEPVELTEAFKGKFTVKNLTELNGNKLIGFAEKVTGDNQTNKAKAIESIIKWQKA